MLHLSRFYKNNRPSRLDEPDDLSDAVGSMRVSDSPQALARRKQDQLVRELQSKRLPPRRQRLLEAATLDAFVTRFSETKNPQRAYVYAHSIMTQRMHTRAAGGQTARGVTTARLRRRNFPG